MIRTTRRLFQVLAAFLILFAAGCSARQQNLSELSPDSMYAEAVEAYDARNFDLASRLLEFFVSEHIGHPQAPDARILLGDLNFTKRDYAIAATHYQRFVQDFPTHPRSLEARFKICDSYSQMSPPPQLDQEFTLAALDHCESVATNFPGSAEATRAEVLIEDLRNKLAQKAYDNGFFYFRRGAYDAAIVYFETVLAEYPTATVAPTALARLVETFERVGYVEDAAAARERLLREYPESEEAREIAA